MNIKKNNKNENKVNNNVIKRINKKEENKDYNSNKIIKSGINYPAIYILSPNPINWQNLIL